MRLDLLEGVRTLQWSVSTHRTHPTSRTPSLGRSATGRCVTDAGRGVPVVVDRDLRGTVVVPMRGDPAAIGSKPSPTSRSCF